MSVFIVAAGGTGSKVVEAFLHLCAAGLGPEEEVDVLLIDGDANNRARLRAKAVYGDYEVMQKWFWATTPPPSVDSPLPLFHTKVTLHELAEGFGGENAESLKRQVHDDPELLKVLRMLLTDVELDHDLNEGFHGCPNLGSLVIARYLKEYVGTPNGRARPFFDRLQNAACEAGTTPMMLVVGSVFGGTGASVLPAIKPALGALFAANQNAAVQGAFGRIQWGSVLVLPYFNVADPAQGEVRTTNPKRHSLDAVYALAFYNKQALANANDPFFIIGSERYDNPERAMKYSAGKLDQPASPFHQELLGAIALLDLISVPQVVEDRVARHFSSQPEVNENKEEPAERALLALLPAPRGLSREKMQRQLALLAHLAAFYVRVAENRGGQFQQGLLKYAQNAILTAWAAESERRRVKEKEALDNANGAGVVALKYFGRFLAWAAAVLPAGEGGLEGGAGDYRSLQNTLCYVKTAEVESADATKDHIVAILCRSAVAGLLREDASHGFSNLRGHRFGRRVQLVNTKRGRIIVRLELFRLSKLLQQGHELSDDITAWYGSR